MPPAATSTGAAAIPQDLLHDTTSHADTETVRAVRPSVSVPTAVGYLIIIIVVIYVLVKLFKPTYFMGTRHTVA